MLTSMDSLLHDFRYATRSLAKSPGFTAVAVLTLTLGIGANAAIFTVVNSVLLDPSPFPEAQRLLWILGQSSLAQRAAISPPDFIDYRDRNTSLNHLGALAYPFLQPHSWVLSNGAQQLRGTMVTADFFETLGAQPILGRTFTRGDERETQPHVAIVSHHLWEQALGADGAIIGKTVRMDSSSLTIVGVMPASFDFPPGADFWYPAPMLARGMQNRLARFLRPVGLLRQGVTMAAAEADLNTVAAYLAETYPEANKGWNLSLQPMQEALVGGVRSGLLILLGAAAFILLIACVNIANLLLARNQLRLKELAIRTAIGAGRLRLLRQLLTESMLLALLGGALALPLALWSVDLVRTFGPQTLPRLSEIRVDWHVLVFTALVSTLTAVGFGLAPGWLATSGVSLQPNLMEGGRTGVSRSRHRVGAGLMIGEISLALCLLIASALLIQSLWRTVSTFPGFSSTGVITTHISLPITSYADPVRSGAFFDRVLAKIQALPGVQAVGGVSELPLKGESNDNWFRIAEHPIANPGDKLNADWRFATPGYFSAIGIPLLRGRLFAALQQRSSSRVVIVDEPFVRRYFPADSPLGKHLLIPGPDGAFLQYEIIGVVGGLRHDALRLSPQPTMYLPYSERIDSHVVVRVAGEPTRLASLIRQIVATEDREVASSAFETMDDVVSASASGDRFSAWLFGLFAGLALMLAAAGVFGVFSHIVTQQTREIGVRLALGASPRKVMRAVLGRGTRAAVTGVSLGAVAALFLVRALASQLYGIRSRDPITFTGSALLLLAVALVAIYVPARRAASVDPIRALRYE